MTPGDAMTELVAESERLGMYPKKGDAKMKYAYSHDEENYTGGFDTLEEACGEALYGGRSEAWVGLAEPPTAPEIYFDPMDFFEHVACQDEYTIDAAGDWYADIEGADKTALQERVRKVIGEWLDENGLRPSFFIVNKPQKYVAKADGTGYELEAK